MWGWLSKTFTCFSARRKPDPALSSSPSHCPPAAPDSPAVHSSQKAGEGELYPECDVSGLKTCSQTSHFLLTAGGVDLRSSHFTAEEMKAQGG